MFDAVLLIVIGGVCGAINTVAGGGSLLSLPLLIFVGVPPVMANATNRIGIVLQNVFAVSGFYQKKVNMLKFSMPLACSGLLGGGIGAYGALQLSDEQFKLVLIVVMIIVAIVMMIDPTQRLHSTREKLDGRQWVYATVAFFFIGLYGGFIQAGVGLISITATTLINGMDLVKSNCVKVTVALCYALVSVVIFAYHGQILFGHGISLGAGMAMGAWFMSRYSVKKGHAWVKKAVVCVIIFMAIRLVFL